MDPLADPGRASGGATPAGTASIDPILVERRLQELRDNQNLGLGFIGGLGGAALGAVVWGFVTALVKVQIGWMAVGVGFLTGLGVRTLGRGVDRSFGILGGMLSLVGCAAGNLLAVCILIADSRQIPLASILGRMTPALASALLTQTFSGMDLLFYGLALYEGYRFSIRRLTSADFAVPGA
ncbi:MAG TPA: hypothetical protein VNL37_04185 [Candidatus Polarisedimenticolia bacterium]|nr:hypothetical protein [Candidatus Polarisedimenticolia bacterium]